MFFVISLHCITNTLEYEISVIGYVDDNPAGPELLLSLGGKPAFATVYFSSYETSASHHLFLLQ